MTLKYYLTKVGRRDDWDTMIKMFTLETYDRKKKHPLIVIALFSYHQNLRDVLYYVYTIYIDCFGEIVG